MTYSAVGATQTNPPQGYVVDRTRVDLGSGEQVYQRAQLALQQWRPLSLGWVEAWPTAKPPQTGSLVAVMGRVLGRAAGLWCVNACRVVYLTDESGPLMRFGFAYGTLPGHIEQGEERFLLEWDRSSDRVRYEILAFSRPNHLAARIGYPLVRRLQKRFGRDSARAVYRAVTNSRLVPSVSQTTCAH